MATWQQARVIDKQAWNQRLISLRLEMELQPFKAGQFIKLGLEIDGERIERPYSLVNTPAETGAEVLFNIVEEGPLTPRLAALKPGDSVWATQDAHGFLVIDEVPAVRHLWMMATGTGVGPFVSMLKSEDSRRFERLVLVHGVRTQDELAYRDTLEKLADESAGSLTYIPVISREQPEGMLSGHLTKRLNDGSLESVAGLQLFADDSHVLLCGNINMIREVQDLLAERGMKKHRRFDPGHISMEKYH